MQSIEARPGTGSVAGSGRGSGTGSPVSSHCIQAPHVFVSLANPAQVTARLEPLMCTHSTRSAFVLTNLELNAIPKTRKSYCPCFSSVSRTQQCISQGFENVLGVISALLVFLAPVHGPKPSSRSLRPSPIAFSKACYLRLALVSPSPELKNRENALKLVSRLRNVTSNSWTTHLYQFQLCRCR